MKESGDRDDAEMSKALAFSIAIEHRPEGIDNKGVVKKLEAKCGGQGVVGE